jgi:hypothetical protein
MISPSTKPYIGLHLHTDTLLAYRKKEQSIWELSLLISNALEQLTKVSKIPNINRGNGIPSPSFYVYTVPYLSI